MQNTLWAIHDAAQSIRAPLVSFYDSLDDQQKQQYAQLEQQMREQFRERMKDSQGAAGGAQ